MHKFLEHETVPVEIRKDYRVCDLVEAMQNISFQGRNLFTAYNVWKSMLQDQVTVFLGLAGAMIPAGMRRVFVTLIRNRMVDCIVSTGANLFHDCHESLGRHHYVGSHLADDVVLRSEGVDRIYDTFASDKEFIKTDEFVIELGRKLADEGRSFTTPAFLYLLGRELLSRAKEPGILTTAAETGIPIFCPALPDSSIGIALAVLHKREGKTVRFDVVGDVWASTEIVLQNRRSGVVYIGGGTPKNLIQQI
jgi:deoxyhypusine synthase